MKKFLPRTREEFTFWALELQGRNQEEIDNYLNESVTCEAQHSPDPLLYSEWIKSTVKNFPDIVHMNVYHTPFNTHVHIAIAGVWVEQLDLKSRSHSKLFAELENLYEVTVN